MMSESSVTLMTRLLRLRYRLAMKYESLSGKKKETYVWDRVPLYRQIWLEAAMELKAEFIELDSGFWEVRGDGCRTRINNHRVQVDNPVTLSLASNKPLCYELMGKNGLPVPDYLVYTLDEAGKAGRFMDERKGFFVVKPAIGTSAGMGITTHISSRKELLSASALASLYCGRLIIERLVPGESCRLLMLDGKLIHASRRKGLRVRGDGKSTIKELLERSGAAPGLSINVDRDAIATLCAQGINAASIPGAGQDILVRSSGASKRKVELRTIYDENITGLVCPALVAQAAAAARSLDARFAGVDIIAMDTSAPLERCSGVINEINTTPGLQHHYNLAYGEKARPAVDVLKYLLKIDQRESGGL